MSSFKCTILSKAETLLDCEVVSVNLPGAGGGFTILAHHTPLIALLAKGNITIQLKDQPEAKIFKIEKGSVEMTHNHAYVLVDLSPA
ncbi:MAG: F0F1 ATP synthase subunit epsilon [Pseudomonadota bacterium]